MAKNRSSSTDVLAGLTNLVKQPTEDIPKIEPVKVEPPKEEGPIVDPQPKEVIVPVVKKKTKTEEANKFTVYLDDRQYLFLKKNGWEYNGMNGFIKHLIDEEQKRRGEN